MIISKRSLISRSQLHLTLFFAIIAQVGHLVLPLSWTNLFQRILILSSGIFVVLSFFIILAIYQRVQHKLLYLWYDFEAFIYYNWQSIIAVIGIGYLWFDPYRLIANSLIQGVTLATMIRVSAGLYQNYVSIDEISLRHRYNHRMSLKHSYALARRCLSHSQTIDDERTCIQLILEVYQYLGSIGNSDGIVSLTKVLREWLQQHQLSPESIGTLLVELRLYYQYAMPKRERRGLLAMILSQLMHLNPPDRTLYQYIKTGILQLRTSEKIHFYQDLAKIEGIEKIMYDLIVYAELGESILQIPELRKIVLEVYQQHSIDQQHNILDALTKESNETSRHWMYEWLFSGISFSQWIHGRFIQTSSTLGNSHRQATPTFSDASISTYIDHIKLLYSQDILNQSNIICILSQLQQYLSHTSRYSSVYPYVEAWNDLWARIMIRVHSRHMV